MYRTADPSQVRIEDRLDNRYARKVGSVGRPLGEPLQAGLSSIGLTGQKLALGQVKIEVKTKLRVALHRVLRQQRAASQKIVERRFIGDSRLRTPACQQVQACQLLSLLFRFEKLAAPVHLIDDVENLALHFLGRHTFRKKSPDSKMSGLSVALR